MGINAGFLTIFVTMSWVITSTVEIHVDGILGLATALVSEEGVAAYADSVRVCLPDVACLMAHRVLQLTPIPYLDLAFGGRAVEVCEAGLAILMAEEDDPTIVICLLDPVVDCVPVLVVQSVEVQWDLEADLGRWDAV